MEQRCQGGGRQHSGNTEAANKAPARLPLQQLWDDRHRGPLYSSVSTEARPFLDPSLPTTHLQPAAVGQVTPQAWSA